MDGIDRYGLSAQFSFGVSGNAFAAMSQVQKQLGGILQAVHQASSAVKKSGLGRSLQAIATQAQGGMGAVTRQTHRFKDVAKQVSALKQEFRALKAEGRNIDQNYWDTSPALSGRL